MARFRDEQGVPAGAYGGTPAAAYAATTRITSSRAINTTTATAAAPPAISALVGLDMSVSSCLVNGGGAGI